MLGEQNRISIEYIPIPNKDFHYNLIDREITKFLQDEKDTQALVLHEDCNLNKVFERLYIPEVFIRSPESIEFSYIENPLGISMYSYFSKTFKWTDLPFNTFILSVELKTAIQVKRFLLWLKNLGYTLGKAKRCLHIKLISDLSEDYKLLIGIMMRQIYDEYYDKVAYDFS